MTNYFSHLRFFMVVVLFLSVATIFFVHNELTYLGEYVGETDAPPKRLVEGIMSTIIANNVTSTMLRGWQSMSGTTNDVGGVTSSLSVVDNEVQSPQWRSSHSAVLAMATNMGLTEYQTFVGSLRATGYDGHIILGIDEHPDEVVIQYLSSQNVTMKRHVGGGL